MEEKRLQGPRDGGRRRRRKGGERGLAEAGGGDEESQGGVAERGVEKEEKLLQTAGKRLRGDDDHVGRLERKGTRGVRVSWARRRSPTAAGGDGGRFRRMRCPER